MLFNVIAKEGPATLRSYNFLLHNIRFIIKNDYVSDFL